MAPTGRLFDPDPYGSTEPTTEPDLGPSAAGDDVVEPGSVAVRVRPDVSGLDREFDYLVPAGLLHRLSLGSLVRVELAGRNVAGWITSIGDEPPPGVALRPIARISSVGPSADLIELARWAARRWSGRLAPILRTASPPRMVPALPGPGTSPPARGRRSPATTAGPAPGPSVVRISPADDVVPFLADVARRGSTLVVAPYLGQARAVAGRLARAGLTVRIHPRDWAAAAGRGGVVIGARSAVWSRVAGLAAIVVLDEHDESLQEERNPTWHARDVAIERAARAGIPCHLVSPAPSLAGLVAAEDRVTTPARSAERAGWPIVEVIDRRNEEPGRSGLFSARVAEVVRSGVRVLAVLNRKGRAIMLACALCGELARTEDGERLMVEVDGRLVAPSTGEERPLVCAGCGSTGLKRLRLGVSRAAEELAALAGEPVDEVTASGRSAGPAARVVVGTEAALHEPGRRDVVVFLDFDQELLAPRYRAAEQAMALLVLAARLVGRRADGGRILVQTRSADHRVLRAAVRADPGLLSDAEEQVRRPMGFPPFGALAEVSGEAAGDFVAGLRSVGGLTVLGPRDGRYLLRADDADRLAEILAGADRPRGRYRVAVDPPRA